jgi:hypothetical protein
MSQTAQAIAQAIEDGKLKHPPMVALILEREAALASERRAHLLAAGVPERAADLLAMDDMGYQLADNVMGWYLDQIEVHAW